MERVAREGQIAVQEAEIQRREKELIATVLKAAEIEKQRVQTLAQAEQQRLMIEAEGKAQSVKAQGEAEAGVVRVRGTAEANVIQAKGEAEARAMQVKADAYKLYTQAAVLDKLLSGLPELARAMAEPLNKVDRITVVSTGGADVGVNKLMSDMAKMIAQAPALVESLTGMKIGEIVSALPGLAERLPAAGSEKN